ncbi:MAG TPA: HAMP domain-containing sensor histidine kinase [Syntrophomonadaceae bacterium]|nr:HAMP domain-containing sensor histidine kinase [Syntrophomonadaceae bacterium]
MSLRVRLLFSYIAMLLIPLVLFPLVALAIGLFYFEDVQHFYNLDYSPASVRRLIQRNATAIQVIKTTAYDNPDKLADSAYLDDIDKGLSSTHAGLVVRKDGKIIYRSNSLKDIDFTNRLPAFGYYRNDLDVRGSAHPPLLDTDDRYSLQQCDFYFTDHSPGTVFLINNVGPIERFVGNFFWSLLLAISLILLITGVSLTFLVSRRISRPIESLKEGALQIKEGNLDFAIKCQSSDEIGQLCSSFEEMRLKLKEAVEIRLQDEENRKELIANISHDLKTPVTAIKGYSEGIMDGVADSPEKMEKYVRTIHTKAQDMDHLIDELFLFSKLDVGKELFNFEKVDMKSYLQNGAEELQLDLDKRNIDLDLDIDNLDQPLWIIADREKIKRVIFNIVDNAVKYMDKEKGHIRISLQERDESAVIGITDNGPGIPLQAIPAVFERFYQVDSSRTKGGSGLGLAIASQIIEEHGGQIWVERNGPSGTSVFFSLRKA